jgi:hypothetical protein
MNFIQSAVSFLDGISNRLYKGESVAQVNAKIILEIERLSNLKLNIWYAKNGFLIRENDLIKPDKDDVAVYLKEDADNCIVELKEKGAICGDGMCPYVPCKNFPNCVHWGNNKIKEEKE